MRTYPGHERKRNADAMFLPSLVLQYLPISPPPSRAQCERHGGQVVSPASPLPRSLYSTLPERTIRPDSSRSFTPFFLAAGRGRGRGPLRGDGGRGGRGKERKEGKRGGEGRTRREEERRREGAIGMCGRGRGGGVLNNANCFYGGFSAFLWCLIYLAWQLQSLIDLLFVGL